MLLFLTLCSALIVFSNEGMEMKYICYGRSLQFPSLITPPVFKGQLYFKPEGESTKKLLMDNGQAKDPRLQISYGSVVLTDLTKRDEGTFAASLPGIREYDIVTLVVTEECVKKLKKFYGRNFEYDIPREAEFLEFIPLESADPPQVIWNRTNPQTNKEGKTQSTDRVWKMFRVTQADSGYYNFRGGNNALLTWIKLTVKELERYYDPHVSADLIIEYPSTEAKWDVSFKPTASLSYKPLMRQNEKDRVDYFTGPSGFEWRMKFTSMGLEVFPLAHSDSGTYHFRDLQGNLALAAVVKVQGGESSTYVYVGAGVGVLVVMICCCCCIRRCCCKKSSSKSYESTPESAAAPTIYHDINQPTSSSYSAAPTAAPPTSAVYYHSVNPLVSTEPMTTSLGTSVTDPVNISVSPPHPEGASLGSQGATPAPAATPTPTPLFSSELFSSDPVPTVTLKGFNVSSVSPLSSAVDDNPVYTSEKFNFA